MNPFYKYVLKKFLYNLFVVLTFILLLYTFFNVIQHTKYIERYNVNIFQIIYFDFLKLPYSLYQIMPVVIILATVITFVLLVRSNELTGFVSLGGRTGSISTIVVLLGLFLSIFTFILGEFIAPEFQTLRQKYKVEVFEKEKFIDYSKIQNIWIKNGDKIIYIDILDPINKNFVKMQEFYLNENKVIKMTEINSGKKIQNKWHFKDIIEYDLTDIPQKAKHQDTLIISNKLLDELSQFSIDNPKLLNIGEIIKFISIYRAKGLNTTQYEIILFNKIAHPISIMIIILAVLPVCMSFSRQYSYIKIVSKSLILGCSYWILNASLISISKTGALNPIIANFLPLLIFATIGVVLIFRKERGF
jgi:lipopolysaccharide export system permease protein